MITSAAEMPSSCISTGMPRPSSVTVTVPSPVQRNRDFRAVARQRLVDGVVDHLVDHVVQARAVVGVADIHAGALADRFQPLEDLDRRRVVSVVGKLRPGFLGWFCHRAS